MQVMSSAEFEQTEVLVGRQGKTESFGVSEDPALMMMLSTGLYSNPHRTMIQEIMFNAWDAHHMVGIQETTPIDIYINDTTGLIIRDYGPGIAKELMTPIYCIYGASTKREDKGSTGGFGLGSKSPYAYTESFTVTSYHKGIQNMYLMSRVSDENDGKPGKTPIIEDIPTEETGLRVIVPLKSEHDMQKTYKYIKDLLFLSGIWANIHFMDDPVETIKADKITAGSWHIEQEDSSHDTSIWDNNIWAVYGGVRYKIPLRDEYYDEYQFIRKIRDHIKSGIFIGFAPDTLTPLPSREGLNMSDRTIENIKSTLETLVEFFEDSLKPITRYCLELSLDELIKTEIDPIYMIYRWRAIGHDFTLSRMLPHILAPINPDKPENIPQNSWESLHYFVWKATLVVAEMLKPKLFTKMLTIVWAKRFPKMKHLSYVSSGDIGKDDPQTHYQIFGPKINEEFHEMLNVLKEHTGQNLNWRALMNHRENWTKIDGWRKRRPQRRSGRLWGKDLIIASLIKEGKLKTPARERTDSFFDNDGDQIYCVWFPKTVIIGKTATALNDTPIAFPNYFATSVDIAHRNYSYSPFHWSSFQNSYQTKPILGLVVHQKKGQYDQAVKILKDAGWTVIEANEPVSKTDNVPIKVTVDSSGNVVETPVVKSSKVSFPLFDHKRKYFHEPSAPEIEKPDYYLWCTRTAIEADSWTDRADRPSSNLRHWIGENLTNVAYIGNKSRMVTLDKLGAKNVAIKIQELAELILDNEQQIQKHVLHQYVSTKSNIPQSLLKLPEMQKFMGLPYLRTKEIDQFETDRLFLYMVQEERWSEIDYDLKQRIKKAINHHYYDEAFFSGVSEMCEKSHVISTSAMQQSIYGMKPGELKVYSEKLMRFLRTI